MSKTLVIGSGAREHAICRALRAAPGMPAIGCLGNSRNPGILALAHVYEVGNILDPSAAVAFAQSLGADEVIIGPEAPLGAGVGDALRAAGFPVFGPSASLARIETSKGFARELMRRHRVPGLPFHQSFDGLAGAAECLRSLGDNYVVKADGLMGGKGVKVSGDHLANHDEALAYIGELVAAKMPYVIEEKCFGPEFSVFTLSDGKSVIHTPAVQDHKRLGEGDTGPNTGGMGSYSDTDHRLPFLSAKDYATATRINELTLEALAGETGEPYRGVLYGGFMATREGVRVIEFNARFGDPECMNLMALIEGDFQACVGGAARGALDPSSIRFRQQASVCKYLVPPGYPEKPQGGFEIDLSEVRDRDAIYFGSVDADGGRLLAGASRNLALVATASSIEKAEQIVEAEINRIPGCLIHRRDVGTRKLIDERVQLLQQLRQPLA